MVCRSYPIRFPHLHAISEFVRRLKWGLSRTRGVSVYALTYESRAPRRLEITGERLSGKKGGRDPDDEGQLDSSATETYWWAGLDDDQRIVNAVKLRLKRGRRAKITTTE